MRIEKNLNPRVVAKNVLLIKLRKQVLPVAFTDFERIDDIPSDVMDMIKKFAEYVKKVDDLLSKVSDDYYIKLSKMRIRRVYGKKKYSNRVYIPEDVIVVLRLKDLEISIMPSEVDVAHRYLVVRRGGKKVCSITVFPIHTLDLLSFLLNLGSMVRRFRAGK